MKTLYQVMSDSLPDCTLNVRGLHMSIAFMILPMPPEQAPTNDDWLTLREMLQTQSLDETQRKYGIWHN